MCIRDRDEGPVHTISIIPTGIGAAGYTMPLPESDRMFNTKGKMLQDIMAVSYTHLDVYKRQSI